MILPPGTLLQQMSFKERLRTLPRGSFVKVGVGQGVVSKTLLDLGWSGRAYDLNAESLAVAAEVNRAAVFERRYGVEQGDWLAAQHRSAWPAYASCRRPYLPRVQPAVPRLGIPRAPRRARQARAQRAGKDAAVGKPRRAFQDRFSGGAAGGAERSGHVSTPFAAKDECAKSPQHGYLRRIFARDMIFDAIGGRQS